MVLNFNARSSECSLEPRSAHFMSCSFLYISKIYSSQMASVHFDIGNRPRKDWPPHIDVKLASNCANCNIHHSAPRFLICWRFTLPIDPLTLYTNKIIAHKYSTTFSLSPPHLFLHGVLSSKFMGYAMAPPQARMRLSRKPSACPPCYTLPIIRQLSAHQLSLRYWLALSYHVPWELIYVGVVT